MEYSITEVAALAGVTSRTLRHYDAIGLLPAGRQVRSGYRSYRQADLVRLQRILLLREQGLGLPDIARILAGRTDDRVALQTHLEQLRAQRGRLERQIASVQRTVTALKKEEQMQAEDMFDGFDHTTYREEVEQRWGEQAYAESDRWWRGLGEEGKQAFMAEAAAISAAWQDLRAEGVAVDDDRAARLAARHVRWIQQGWGGRQPSSEAIEGLAQMYVADERFAANYGGPAGATYVRDALLIHARSM